MIADFKTPEEYFLGEKPAKFEWGSMNPTEFLKSATARDKTIKYHSAVGALQEYIQLTMLGMKTSLPVPNLGWTVWPLEYKWNQLKSISVLVKLCS